MASLRVVVRSMEQFIEGAIKRLALDITANLVRAPSEGGTPVDTGWARANWIPSVSAPASALRDPGSRDARAASVGGASSAQAAGQADVLGYKLSRGPVYVSNNVPYIVRLNEGSSRQAPKGFVQAAIAKAVRVDLGAGFGL